MQKAIILCAGRGTRMGTLTKDNPKPLTPVNGTTILENAVQQLIAANYTSLVLVVGYEAEKIRQAMRPFEGEINITYIVNEVWSTTNNIYSLWLAKEELKGEFTLLEADLFFNNTVLPTLLAFPPQKNYVLVSPLNKLMEGTFVKMDEDGSIESFDSTKNPDFRPTVGQFKTVNIYKFNTGFSKKLFDKLDEQVEAGNVNFYYEEVFKTLLTEKEVSYQAIVIPHDAWQEIDDMYDLRIGEFHFSNDPHTILKHQHGGYWRYPITDHCLIYNFHFPPKDLKRKMQQRFDDLLLNYPSCSGYMVNHLAAFLQVPAKNLVMANGVSEIIKILPKIMQGTIALIEPSFNEYASCFGERAKKFYVDEDEEFGINIDSLIHFVKEQEVEAIVLVSPDNPTGKLHNKKDILKLYRETEDQQLHIIVDESFIDFSSREEEESFLHELSRYPRITVLKSMSKTFGIGGLRLGYAATFNADFLQRLRSEIPIWNINGFAEEFILNLPAYYNSYKESCKKVRRDTDDLFADLSKLEGIKVFSTESNFILGKVLIEGVDADCLAKKLISGYNIFIKECSGKSMENSELYFRISARTKQENIRLANALSACLNELIKGGEPANVIEMQVP